MMKKFLMFILSIFSINLIFAQYCPNSDFSKLNFSNWDGYIGTYSNCCPTKITTPGRHTIIDTTLIDTNLFDKRTGGRLRMIPPGEKQCARLGNEQVGAQAEKLVYNFKVTPLNSILVYKYAVVFEDPAHAISEQPKFEIKVIDSLGYLVNPTCGYYKVVSSANITGFENFGTVRWRNWTTNAIDLTAYMGKTISIEFSVYDCLASGHYGYAYLTTKCYPSIIKVDYCDKFKIATLATPPGFTYKWSNGDSTQIIIIQNPKIASQYSCTITAVTGCKYTLNATILKDTITPDYIVNNVCDTTYKVNFKNLSTSKNSNIVKFSWDFGDGSPIDTINWNPNHRYKTSGDYMVKLYLMNSSFCDTLMIRKESICQITNMKNKDIYNYILQPNPAHDDVTIKSKEKIREIIIKNIVGQTIYVAKPNDNNIYVGLKSFPKGIYIVEINTSKNIVVRKLMKE